ncbi:MAG: polymer-forming cytoskeletal protein [Pseudomonadota bacterium]|nr:polymer-forming cytoskeletal protein [Pseudomonadota bacterium]
MFGKGKAATPAIDSLLGATTRIQGDLQFGGGLHLDGSVTGNVRPVEGDSRLVIGETGIVEGSCEAQLVELYGTVKGDIRAPRKVVLGPRATVEGNLHYGALEMAAGATIKGKLLKL